MSIHQTLLQISEAYGFDVREFVGQSFEDILLEADRVGGWNVYWGMFSLSDLEHIVTLADC